MERLLNRQGCCPPSPSARRDVAAGLRVALIPSVIKGAASRGVSPGSAWAQSPTDFSRNAAAPRSANRDTDDETMSRCQLLPVSTTNVGHDGWTLKSADVDKGWCFCCPTRREIEAMVVEVADTLGGGTR